MDFAGLFEAMSGLPVVIRTLDPSLLEFVAGQEQLAINVARLPAADPGRPFALVIHYLR